jgi:DNA-binding LacI/PurR family transcriptional regulator/DNA-binding transcriptional regulator YhcF (GntR family)
MATRREAEKRREEIKKTLREEKRNGTLPPGALVPPVRELAQRYQLSVNGVCQVLQDLVEEGLLYTVPRVGTFVGQPQPLAQEFYLMLLPERHGITDEHHARQIQVGFETRIAHRGGASLVMPLTQALRTRHAGGLPLICGVFDFAYHPGDKLTWGAECGVPRVGFSGRIEDGIECDKVSYDDIDGGRQATQHLIQMGHQHIAYLGLHSVQHEQLGEFVWSQEREEGWKDVMRQAGLSYEGLSFHPTVTPKQNCDQEIRAARKVALSILRRPNITAVVTANDFAAMGLFEAARAARIPPVNWPSVVAFDDLPHANGHIVTSLRYSGEEIGRAAADLLWERRHGMLTGPPQHRRANMRLIPRLTSHMDWSLTAGHVALVAPSC